MPYRTVIDMAPQMSKGVVAEMCFVDMITTMLDPDSERRM